MKKIYMTPEAEKIQFNYRDQVVAASTPGVGEFYGNESWDSGCKIYLAEAAGIALCGILSLK